MITLTCLITMQVFWSDFGPSPAIVGVSVFSACLVQIILTKIFRIPLDLRSPFITGMSISILLKAGTVWFYPLASMLAIGSKFLIRSQNKHIFNPANIAIVIMLLLFPQYIWVSPGQWGGAIWLFFFLASMALLVLYKIPRRDMAIIFLSIWSGLLFGRALWLGDPLEIPMHQLQNGALLIFAFFMISDPKTIPDRRIGRIIFASIVAGVAYVLQFEYQIREGLFYALAVACVARPFLDMIWRGETFHWTNNLILSKEEKI